MSDVVRVYNRAMSLGNRRGRTRRVVLSLLGVVLLWLVWTTRDSQPMGKLIPAKQTYQVYVGDPMGKRAAIAQSPLWSLAPKDSSVAKLRAQLAVNFGVPEWILNNLIYGVCHVSGNDMKAFSDPLIVTRMSRIGCLIEKCHYFVPGLHGDYAGGLRLRTLSKAGLFYAVRGRVLLMSPSRDALIRALTLTNEQTVGRDALVKIARELGSDSVSAHLNFGEHDQLGDLFESARLELRMGRDALRLNCEATLRPACRERMAGILGKAAPRTLLLPPEGFLMLTSDFGETLPECWSGLNKAFPSVFSSELLAPLAKLPNAAAAAPLLGLLGPGIRLSWTGVDQNEMLPTPELVGTFDADPDQVRALLGAIPAPPAGTPPWESYPRYDAASGMLCLPLVGGPSMEPTAAPYGKSLLISSSRSVAENLLSKAPLSEAVPEPGNLYLRIQPYPALQSLVQAAEPFVELGVVRGQNPGSFQKATAPWLDSVKQIHEISALAAHEDGRVRASLVIAFGAP